MGYGSNILGRLVYKYSLLRIPTWNTSEFECPVITKSDITKSSNGPEILPSDYII